LCKHLGTSPKELQAICDTVRDGSTKCYREQDKVVNGKLRHLAEPRGRLRVLLERLNALLQRLKLPDCLHGGIRGRSNKTNARAHVGKPMLLKFDIEDFFPNVKHCMVYRMFVERLGCRASVAAKLTRLTTLRGCLPQGSPTSTIVANLVIEPLALRMNGLAQQHGAGYGQFVDDGTISGPAHLRALVPLVKRIVAQEGFRAKEGKTQCVDAEQEQVVTGCRVNQQLDIPSEKVKEVRGILESLRADIEQDHLPTAKRLASIEGKIRYVTGLNRGTGRRLHHQYLRVIVALPRSGATRAVLKAPAR